MASIQFKKLWDNHPFNTFPCNRAVFANQCAIRMGVTMEASGIDTSSFDKMYPKRRCYPGMKHNSSHILSAEQLAKWMHANPNIFGKRIVIKDEREKELKHKKGFLFIHNGWKQGDHIDLWDGTKMRAGEYNWLNKGDALWFWEVKL